MPRQCLLIADDLTGACDAAVHFAHRGHRTVVLTSMEAGEVECEVLAISVDSRDFDDSAIRALWSRAVDCFGLDPARLLIKKIDSTLRGLPGLEIELARRAFQCDAAIVTPALPAMGRVVVDGWLHLRGDAGFTPIDVVGLLRGQGLADCAGAVIVADATDESDLDRIVAEAMPHEGRLLWAGSAGLVAALARALPAGSRRESLEPSQMPGIFCIGSDHKVTVAQVEALLATGNAKLVAAEVPRDTHAVFAVPRGCDPRAVRDVLAQIPAAPLVLSGGDTASLVCRAIGASGIDLYDEILPGIPRGVLRGGEFDGRAVATKSGGFGRPDALIQVAEFLSCPVKQM